MNNLQDKIANLMLKEMGESCVGYRHHVARLICEKFIDDPEMDGTDFAHPAYLRGEDATVKKFCKIVNDILDGTKANVGTASGPWQQLRQRLYDIRTLLGIAERVVDAAGFIGIAKLSVMQWYKVRNDYAKRLRRANQ